MSFRDDACTTVDALVAYAEQARRGEVPVVCQPQLAVLTRDLELERLLAEGGLEGDQLKQFLDRYLAASTRLQHPHYMAHQVSVPIPHGSLAALIDGFTNNAMAIYEMGPSAAAVEHAVLNWMMAKVGWRTRDAGSPRGAGVLTHGGSLANLTALLAARARCAPRAWTDGVPGNLVLVCSPSSHYSISRAAAILGIGERGIRHAATDKLGRIDPAALSDLLRQLRDSGEVPIAVVANGGSTALGLFDPIRDIAAVCREHGVWLHVDGAHGASTLLSPRFRHLLDGIEDADSIIWDAHKMLRSPVLCAAVLVRDENALDNAFHQEAGYLFHDKEQPGIDFIHRTVECTKAALGLKIFFAVAHGGERAIAGMIERQTDLAKAAADLLRAAPGVEVAVEPETNIVCFRVEGPDTLQLEIRKRLTRDGAFYISTAEALGRRWLRLAFMNPDTTLDDVSALLSEVVELRS